MPISACTSSSIATSNGRVCLADKSCSGKKERTFGLGVRFETRWLFPLCMDRSLGGWETVNSKAICTTGRVVGSPKNGSVVYLRGVNGEDLSTFIKSVTFTLHSTFRQNQRGGFLDSLLK